MQRAIDFIGHLFSSKTRHGTHSPFIYALIEDCVYKQKPLPEREIKLFFETLKTNDELISGADFGNGGRQVTRTISHYAKTSSMLDFQANLLCRLVAYLKPHFILELGTNIGKSGAYMASANRDCRMITIDANDGLKCLADKHFQYLELFNVECRAQTFETFFNENNDSFDFIFLDGNHHYEPTIEYYKSLKTIVNSGGALVFHDIYYNAGMKKAWAEIKRDQDVSVSLDLFFFGIVWFGKNQAKEDFKIRFPKPLFRLF
jgi:predicted O-methyltransferase YrrM